MGQPLCIYHGHCADGFSAAWVVRRFYGNGRVELVPGVYQQAPPDVAGRDVVVVDFSYPRPVLLEMARVARSILILDHHASAERELQDLPENVRAVFDMERSGARMAWDHFFPDQGPPRLLSHVQDRDLWRFKLAFTREVNAALFSYPYDFEVWDRLMASDCHKLVRDGRAILRKQAKDIEELIGASLRLMAIGGLEVPVANLPYTLASDACHEMCAGDDVPFAASYMDGPQGRSFSLRSRPGGADVSLIAAQYGGGGHVHAAGFKVPWGHALAPDGGGDRG